MNYTEDTLVQQTTADYLEQQLGWKSVYAYNHAEPARVKIRPVGDKRLLCDT